MKSSSQKLSGSQIGKAVLSYVLVIYCCFVFFFSPVLNILLEPFSREEAKTALSLMFFLCYLFLPPTLYLLFQEGDSRKRRLALLHQTEPSFRTLAREVWHSFDFYANGMPLLALLVLLPLGESLRVLIDVFSFLGGFFSLIVARLLYGAMQFCLLFLCEMMIRKDWFHRWRYACFACLPTGEADLPVASKKRMALSVLCVTLAVYLLPSLGIYLHVFRIVYMLFGTTSNLILLLLVLFLGPTVAHWRRKKRFLRRLKGHCSGLGFACSVSSSPLHGMVGLGKRADFTVETKSTVYVGRVIPVRTRHSVLLFDPKGSYRFEKRLWVWYIPFLRHRIPEAALEKDGKSIRSILIFTTEPKGSYLDEDGTVRQIWSHDTVAGYELFSTDAFISALVPRNPVY